MRTIIIPLYHFHPSMNVAKFSWIYVFEMSTWWAYSSISYGKSEIAIEFYIETYKIQMKRGFY